MSLKPAPFDADEDLSGKDLRKARLRRCDLSGRDLSEANLSHADLRGADLERACAREANFTGARLRGGRLEKAELGRATLSDVDLVDADLREADLTGADLTGALLDHACLRGADLSEARLSMLPLRHVDLRGATLREADLSGSRVRYGELKDADLSRATLTGADLSFADLRGATLKGATLDQADLSGANLERADLREASLKGTRMSWVLGLDPETRQDIQARGARIAVSSVANTWARFNFVARRHAATLYLVSLVIVLLVAVVTARWIGSGLTQTNVYPLNAHPAGILFEIDCGGPREREYKGRAGFKGGKRVKVKTAGIQRIKSAPRKVYASMREGPEFEYKFRASRGWYAVELHFVETRHSHRGNRAFRIMLEDHSVVDSFDVLVETYPQTVHVRRFGVWVDDGVLNLEFRRHQGDAMISFIRVRRLDVSPGWRRNRGDR